MAQQATRVSTSHELSTPDIRDHYPEFTQRLEARRAELLEAVRTARANLDEQVMDSPGDVGDESVVDTNADYFLNRANTNQRELVEIGDALERMHRGVYGICESCENPISIERLRKLPYARMDVDCQGAAERRNPLYRVPPKL
jgi:DnaK suppressor protein